MFDTVTISCPDVEEVLVWAEEGICCTFSLPSLDLENIEIPNFLCFGKESTEMKFRDIRKAIRI